MSGKRLLKRPVCCSLSTDAGAVKVCPGTNVEPRTTRYRMGLDEVVDVLGEMELQG